MPRVPALDISVWDEGIDLTEWKRCHGIQAVIVKCGGNEGGRYRDKCFADHMRKAKAAGLAVGVYYYTTSTTVADAIADADHCAGLLDGYDLNMPVFMDVEDQRQFGLSKRVLTEVIAAFCMQIQSHGYRAGLYTGGYAFNNNMYADELRQYYTWIASWSESWPTYVGSIDMWQQGTKRLIDGAVFYDDIPGCQDFDWVEDYVIEQGGGDMGKLTYALAAAEVMDHFVDHDAHGYSQIHRDGTSEVETITLSDGTQVSFQSGDRDCSRLVQTCYVVVGVLPKGLHVWTGNEREVLLENGFIEVPLDALQRGDVLWRSGHTELYMGDNIEAGARRSETGGIDGRTGDQDGGEIDRSTFVRSHWTSAYRCAKRRPGEGGASHAPADLDTTIGGGDMVGLIHQTDSAGATHVYYWDGVGAPQHISPDQLAGISRFYKLTHDGAAIPVCKDMPQSEFEAICKL